ncbi:DMT family transporter [Gordonia malaquae]|uniref:DMT family transporter n=1 Tax=Gordonia malaquae TaxID=410332 RepID=UPI00301874A1
MKAWRYLAAAIVAEVVSTLTLRATVDNLWFAGFVVCGYALAYYLVARALRAGMSIGAAYGIWGAFGVSIVAVLGSVIFDEHLSTTALAGICVIVAGVVLVELGSPSHSTADEGA